MNPSETLHQLQQLKLKGMLQVYKVQSALPIDQQPDAHELVAM